MLTGKIKRRLIQSNTGSVLVMTLVISFASIALGAAYLKYADHQRQRLSYDIMRYKAWAAAHAALVRGMTLHPSSGMEYTSPRQEFYSDENEEFSIDWRYRCGTPNREQFNFNELTTYTIEGFAYIGSHEFGYEDEFSVAHDMSTRSYADWLYITDRETQSYRLPEDAGSDTLYFWGSDTLNGKVHSNDMIAFQPRNGAWPVFEEKVTSCSTHFNPYNAPYVVNFNGGYQLSYTYFPFPLQADSVRKYGTYPELSFPPGGYPITEIVLQNNGFLLRHRQEPTALIDTMKYRDCGGQQPCFRAEFYDALLDNPGIYHSYPPNGALFIYGEVWITAAKNDDHYNYNANSYFGCDQYYLPLTGFSGRLTIGARGDIIIPQDVVYASSINGEVPKYSTDALGLISERHILVWRKAPSVVKINAGLGAIGFGMDEIDSSLAVRCSRPYQFYPEVGSFGTISMDGINCYGQSNEKTQLYIEGCLIQRERGLIHTHHTKPPYPVQYRGFISKDYVYDKRFLKDPPPHFFAVSPPDNAYIEPEIEAQTPPKKWW